MLNVTYLIAGLTIFSFSWIPNVLSVFYQTSIWAVSLTLQICGLLLILLATSTPYLTRIGMSWRKAHATPLGLSSLGILPGLFLIIHEILSPDFDFRNDELFILIHFGAGALALIMAILLWKFNSKKQNPSSVPIVSTFLAWSAIEMYQVISSLIMGSGYGSGEIPLLIGSFLTLILLFYSIRWTTKPPVTSFTEIVKRMLTGIVPFVIG